MAGGGHDETRELLGYDRLLNFHQTTFPELRRRAARGPGAPAVVELPVAALRWTQDSINCRMVFGIGPRQDGSLYELLHELLSGRADVAALHPLDVVLDGRRLYSVSNRRLAVAKMLQAMHQHKEVKVPCHLYLPNDPRIAERYGRHRTTTAQLGYGLGIALCGAAPEAWHMGRPLFRGAHDWYELEETDSEPEGQAVGRDSRVTRRQARSGRAATGPGGEVPAGVPRPATPSTWQPQLFPPAPSEAPSRIEPPPHPAHWVQAGSGWRQVGGSDGAGGGDADARNTEAAPPEEAALLQSLRLELAELRGRGFPQGYTWSGVLVPLFWLATEPHRPALRALWLEQGLPAETLDALERGMDAAGVHSATDLCHWLRQRRGGTGSEPLGYFQAAEQAKRCWVAVVAGPTAAVPSQAPEAAPAAGTSAALVAGGRRGRDDEQQLATEEATEEAAEEAEEDPAATSVGAALARAGPPPGLDEEGDDEEAFAEDGAAGVGEAAEAHRLAAAQNVNVRLALDPGSDGSARGSDSEPEFDAAAAEAPAEAEYEREEDILREFARQPRTASLDMLPELLAFGSFRCITGTDRAGRRAKGEVIVEKGLRTMIGCRVHVVGLLNRNGSWDQDKCWVRIQIAKLQNGADPSLARGSWGDAASRATMLYGRVVHSAPSGMPRQRVVICVRSRMIRKPTKVGFRPANGKLPNISVPWDEAAEPPRLDDLHAIEIVEWAGGDNLPKGRYLHPMNMRHRHSNNEILESVRISLNYRCDWDGRELAIPPGLFPERAGGGQPPNSFGAPVVAFDHPSSPVSLAFSIADASLSVHIVDVSEVLASPLGVPFEEVARRRAVGTSFTEALGRRIRDVALPLFPEEFVTRAQFAAGRVSHAVTFTFDFSATNGSINLAQARHTATLVRCERLLTPAEACAMLESDRAEDQTARSVRELHRRAALFERWLLGVGNPLALRALDVDFAEAANLAGGCPLTRRANLVVGRMISVCRLLVNTYASRVLRDSAAWALLAPRGEAEEGAYTVQHVQGKPDPLMRNEVWRALGKHIDPTGACISVAAAGEAITDFVSRPHLAYEQRQCIQAGLLKYLRRALPRCFYKIVPGRATPGRGRPWVEGAEVHGDDATFGAAEPLTCYMDVLALRVLRLQAGWRPLGEHLLLSREELEEAVARVNARKESADLARYIFRQVDLMNFLGAGGRVVDNVIVGNVRPTLMGLLVPTLTEHPVDLQLPYSALNGAFCAAEYLPVTKELRIRYQGSQEMRMFKMRPWHPNRLVIVVSRNFAQTIPHHAPPSSVVVSELRLTGGGQHNRHTVTLDTGHRMFPEVFSCEPNLERWHLLNTDIYAYKDIWDAIKTCQVHAAASADVGYADPLVARAVQWYFAQPGVQHFHCLVEKPMVRGMEHGIEAGDLVILKRSCRGAVEVVVYGIVDNVNPNRVQWRTQMCRDSRCDRIHCNYAHSQEEMSRTLLNVHVQLSDISALARHSQRELIERPGNPFTIQFIFVPMADKKSLAFVRSTPQYVHGNGRRRPIGAELISARNALQQRDQQEERPLATPEQMQRARRQTDFQITDLSRLNTLQRGAVSRGLQRAFSMVQGPPGTGKTTFLVRLIVLLLNLECDATYRGGWATVEAGRRNGHRDPGKILVCTPSNHAADEVLQRLVRHTSLRDTPQFVTRVYARSIEKAHGSRYQGGIFGTRSDGGFGIRTELAEHSLHFKAMNERGVFDRLHGLPLTGRGAGQTAFDTAYESAEIDVLNRSRVVITTCTSAYLHTALNQGSDPTRIRRTVDFSTVIIDEAAQASEPDVILPALLARERVVVVGDHKQLGPVVAEPNLSKVFVGVLETPFIERYIKRTEGREDVHTMLNMQYRMHPTIRRFPSNHFYENRLVDCVRPQPDLGDFGQVFPQQGEHVVFIDCTGYHSYGRLTLDGRERGSSAGFVEITTSLKNDEEAETVVEAYRRLLENPQCGPSDVAIITPYRAQQAKIRLLLDSVVGLQSRDTSVGTVHALQGSERDFVILSFVRSTPQEVVADIETPSAADLPGDADRRDPALRQIFETNLGIVSDSKLLNVSLTRAKRGLICVGNRTVLAGGSADFLELSEDLADRYCLLSRDQFVELGR